jgi:hypothetical protein
MKIFVCWKGRKFCSKRIFRKKINNSFQTSQNSFLTNDDYVFVRILQNKSLKFLT